MEERLQSVRDMYRAFAAGDRDTVERFLADDLTEILSFRDGQICAVEVYSGWDVK